MLSITYVMVRSAEGASRTTHGGRAAPGFRFETNSFTRSCAGTTTGQAFRRRGGRWLMRPGDGVEVVEQGGDAA